MELKEKKLTSEKIYTGRIITLYRDTVLCPNGEESVREVIRHSEAAAVLPLTADGKVLLEHQFRYPFGEILTEIPAGKCDPGENPEQTARRELEEETGKRAGRLVPLGRYYCTPAYSDEVIYLYLAEDLSEGRVHLDRDETLDVFEVPVAEFLAMCDDGRITDGKSLAAAYHYLRRKVI